MGILEVTFTSYYGAIDILTLNNGAFNAIKMSYPHYW